MGCRASSLASTKHSPFFIMYQEQMRLPIDVNMMSIAIDCDTLEEEDLDKTIQVLLDSRKKIFEKVE